MEEVINGILIREVETKNIMTKSSLPVGGYSVNPYVGCTHACKYCYASFMKRFTGHKEEWGTFLDVKHWPKIKNPKKYAGQRVVIGSVTDGYNPQEEQFGNTRKLLEQLIGSDADILICTKSDLVVRDIDLLKKLGRVTVSWSINTLDENFKNDMDSASSIEHRIAAMKQVYEAGIRTVCFVSPVFPGITNFEAIFERVKDQCDLFWLENLNLRGGFKKTIMDYIAGKYPDLVPLYDEIYNKHNRSYFEALEVKAEKMAKKYDCAFVDNEMPYGRVPQGHPVIVDYMEWFNVFGLIFIAVIMIPNVVFAIKCKDGFDNKWNNKYVEVTEQVGRLGCFGFMIINIPRTWFGWWSDEAFALYLIVDTILVMLYCAIWIICFKKNSVFRALALSIIPSMLFLFSGIMSRSVLLIIASVLFAPSHIVISYKNVK